MSQFFTSYGQIIGASASASILPVNTQNWFFFWRGVGMDCFDLLAVQGTLKSLLQHHSSKGMCVCHLSVTSYSPCVYLTTKTEFKWCAKMRVKTQCPIYTHLVTRTGSCCIQGTVMDKSHAGIGPESPGWIIKHDCLYFGCHSCFVFFDWKDISKKIFLYVWFGRQNFSQHRPYGEIISKYIHLSSAVKFVGLYVPSDISL